MLSRLLRQLLFYFVHFVVDVLVAVQKIWQQYSSKKCSLPVEKSKHSDIRMILDHMPKITKSLKHLVFIADTQNHTYEDLAQVVIWGLVAGIPFVSFHDITGQLKENEEKLFLEIERCKRGVPGCIKWSKKPDLNGYTNGIQAHTVVINIFSNRDGRPRISQCIREIAEKNSEYQHSEFTAQDLDKVLSLLYPSIPDPDVVLYTGQFCCTHGFLPWQIRLTEFIKLSLDHRVNVDNFIGALYKYNKCDQRYGK